MYVSLSRMHTYSYLRPGILVYCKILALCKLGGRISSLNWFELPSVKCSNFLHFKITKIQTIKCVERIWNTKIRQCVLKTNVFQGTLIYMYKIHEFERKHNWIIIYCYVQIWRNVKLMQIKIRVVYIRLAFFLNECRILIITVFIHWR